MRSFLLLLPLLSACTGDGIKAGNIGDDTADTGGGSGDDSGDHDSSGADDSGADDSGGTDDSGDSGSTDGCTYSETTAIVTDIDETLTTDDLEWLHELADPDYDPEMRPDANTMMQMYHELGYRILYVTARGQDLGPIDGTSAMDATTGWLDNHGFPYEDGDVYLSEGYGVTGEDAATYKTETLSALQDEGVTLVYAYGNADTDIEAFQAVGIPDDHIFLVGDLAGEYGVEGITNYDAYTQHIADFMPSVPCAD